MANNENTNNKEVVAPTTTPKSKTTKPNFKDNSATNQCLKILDWLFEKGSITTAQAREYLDVMSPAARILQLKKVGYQIITIWDSWTSEHGIKHRIGRYVLTQKQPINDNISEVQA
ncbi:MAG: helix-turn-helix domain-containing protein [Methylotenera sp.]|uniref:helix-turn-helix domain-containing protein n=1 Tax=Methylotenera sp. TaxID=2051956 RepID=UPI00248787DB|nr:helix-turn-helix domain-containing protein [Methylotenera sp.]MDI1308460.1 helix-turn-helix domain-containing protein [Methylotenera sp.]